MQKLNRKKSKKDIKTEKIKINDKTKKDIKTEKINIKTEKIKINDKTKKDIKTEKIKIKTENLKLFIIFIIAILIRIYNDPTIPFHYDPGKNLVYSRAILDSFPLFPQYNNYFNLGEYYEYQVLFPYIVALEHKITGLPLVNLASISIIIIGSLIPITVYLLSIEIFGNEKAGLVSALIISIDKIQLFSYMNYYPQILALMLMPLAFLCIIRYSKSTDKKYLIYTSFLSSAIILSSYIAGFVYLSILAISLILYSIIKKEIRYLYALISIIVYITGLTLFYTLPIIDRHGIQSFITGAIGAIFTKKDIPFTNGPIDTIISQVFNYIYIILFLIIIFIIYIIRINIIRTKLTKDKLTRLSFKDIKYEYILLSMWTIFCFILMESYRFRPILWADRYIEFLDMALVILVGYSIYFFIDKIKSFSRINNKIIPIIIMIMVFTYPAVDVIKHNYVFGYWNTPIDLDALNFVQKSIKGDSLFVTSSGITSFWVSALGGVHVLGGESSQILGDKFDGNSYSDTIINSPNLSEKLNLIRKFGVQYIYLTLRTPKFLLWRNDYNIEGLKALDNPNYFDMIYRKEDSASAVIILKVKEDLIPKYNKEKEDTNITILGYILSIGTLLITIVLWRRYVKPTLRIRVAKNS